MSEIINTGLALFFLVTLILIHALRKKIEPVELPAYNRMANGAVVLAAMSVANLFVSSGMIDALPIIGDRAAAGIILWIAAMIGTVMLVSGISHWLPLSRRHKEALQRRTERMEVINKMSRFLATDSRTDAVLAAAVRFIEQHLPYSRIGAFTISQRSGETRLVASFSRSGTELNTADLRFNSAALDRLGNDTDPQSLLAATPDTMRLPDAVVPMHVGSRAVGFFLLWDEAISREAAASVATVQQVARLISNHITSQRLTIETDYRRRREQLQSALMADIDPTRSLPENIIAMARIILHREPVSMVSLTLPSHWPGYQRITVSANDAILQEKQVCTDLTDDVLQELFDDGRPRLIRSSGSAQPAWIAPFVAGDTFGSVLLLPVVVREQVQAVITAAVDTSGMSAAQQSILGAVTHPVATVLQTEHFRLQTALQADRLARITSFVRRIAGDGAPGNIYQHAANMLAENIECSMVRISTYDSDGQFLSSQALRTRHRVESITPANGSMILSLMPLHRAVHDTRRTHRVNQLITEQQMDEAECHQALTPALGSAVLVPIVKQGRTIGVISVAEQREYHRSHLAKVDITFIEAVAACLATAVELPTPQPSREEDRTLTYLDVLRQIESGELAVSRSPQPVSIEPTTLIEEQ